MSLSRTRPGLAVTLALSACAAAVAVGLCVAPAYAHDGRLVVSKASELRDGEWITVSGEDLAPNEPNITVGQCPTAVSPMTDCNLQLGMQTVVTNSAGVFGPVNLRVLASFPAADCRRTTCVIKIFATGSAAAAVPISFLDLATATATPATDPPGTTPAALAFAPPEPAVIESSSAAPLAAKNTSGAADAYPVLVMAGVALAVVLLVAGLVARNRRRRPTVS